LSKDTDLLLRTVSVAGPTALVLGHLTPELEELAVSLTVSYSDGGHNELIGISLTGSGKNGMRMAKAGDKKRFRGYMV
jgi:hypothetical protein